MLTLKSNFVVRSLFLIVLGLSIFSCSSDSDENTAIEETVVSSDDPMAVIDDSVQPIAEESNPYSDPYIDSTSENNPYDSGEETSNPLDNELSRLNAVPIGDSNIDAEDDPTLAVPDTEPEIENSSEDYATNDRGSDSYTGFGEYIVQPGDSLAKIADLLYGDYKRWADLAAENEIVNPAKILPGDVIRYSKSDSQMVGSGIEKSEADYTTVTVKKGDTLSKLAVRIFGKSSFWRTLWRYNQDELPDPNRIKAGQILRYLEPDSYRAAFKSPDSAASLGH